MRQSRSVSQAGQLLRHLGVEQDDPAVFDLVVRDCDRTVVLYSDSSYVLGLLGKGWKPKANRELVSELRALTTRFSDLRFVKVPGHAGVPENERADQLARDAITRRR